MFKSILIASALCLSVGVARAEESAAGSGASADTPAQGAPAHDDKPPDTLFGPMHGIRDVGFYVAPSLGMTTLGGDAAYLAGLEGALLLNHSFGVGVAGWVMTNDTSYSGSSGGVDGAYAGLVLKYVLLPGEVVHGSFDTMIGGGTACSGADRRDNGCPNEYGFFAVQPMANLDINLAKYVRLSLGGGYRFASAEQGSPLSGGDLRGVVVRSAFEFGRF